jgi:putative hydrolase of the HAD superfamily
VTTSVRAVIFDFYDTLARIEAPIIAAGRQELARRVGVPLARFQPLWRENRVARMLGTAGDMETQLRAMLAKVEIEPAPAELAALAFLEFRSWAQGVKLYADTRPSLVALRQRGLKLGILSNCSIQAGAVVHALEVSALVDAVVLSCDVGLAKPDPAIYQQVCAALGVAPADAIFVGDGAGGELEAAAELGLLAVKIRRLDQQAPEDQAVQADHRIESLEELHELLAGD